MDINNPGPSRPPYLMILTFYRPLRGSDVVPSGHGQKVEVLKVRREMGPTEYSVLITARQFPPAFPIYPSGI